MQKTSGKQLSFMFSGFCNDGKLVDGDKKGWVDLELCCASQLMIPRNVLNNVDRDWFRIDSEAL